MKIFPIQKTHSKNSFTSGERGSLQSSIQKSVNSNMKTLRPEIINRLTQNTYDDFMQGISWKQFLKYNNAENRACVLDKMAHSYEPHDINKSAVILAASIAQVGEQKDFKADNEDLKLLNKFFYSSNDYEAKFYVMSVLNKNGSKDFVPIAENILECNESIATLNDKKTNYQARILLNKHHNLNKLSAFTNSSDVLKMAMLDIVAKWGIQAHVKIVQPLLEDENFRISDKAQSTINKLNSLQSYQNIEIGKEHDRKISSDEMRFDNALQGKLALGVRGSASLEEIKLLGRFGYLSSHAAVAKLHALDDSKQSLIAAQAYIKICARGDFIFN